MNIPPNLESTYKSCQELLDCLDIGLGYWLRKGERPKHPCPVCFVPGVLMAKIRVRVIFICPTWFFKKFLSSCQTSEFLASLKKPEDLATLGSCSCHGNEPQVGQRLSLWVVYPLSCLAQCHLTFLLLCMASFTQLICLILEGLSVCYPRRTYFLAYALWTGWN